MHKLLVLVAVLVMLAIVLVELWPTLQRWCAIYLDNSSIVAPPTSPRQTDAPANSQQPNDSSSGNQARVEAPAIAPEVVKELAVNSVKKAPLLSFYGSLHLARLAVAEELQLTLKTKGAERPIWTDQHGEFTFVVATDELPFELCGAAGELLYEYSAYRADRAPRYVNVNLLADFGADDLLKPRRVVAERLEGDNYRIAVFGACGLAVDSSLSTYLLSGDRTVGATSKPWGNERLFGEIVMQDRSLHSGKYALRVVWKLSSATTEQIAAVAGSLEKPPPLELQARRPIYLGRPTDEKAEEQRILAYVRSTLLEAQAARDMILFLGWELREKSKSGARNNPLDPARKENAGRLELLERYSPFKFLQGIISGSSIDLDRWREFIDKDLPARWEPFQNSKNIPFPVKYPVLTAQVPLLFQHLKKLSHLESRLIYEGLGLNPHRHDFVDGDWEINTERRETVRRVDDCYQSIREAVGIERFRPDAPK